MKTFCRRKQPQEENITKGIMIITLNQNYESISFSKQGSMSTKNTGY